MQISLSDNRAKQLVDAFAQQHVLVVGDAMLDRYISGRVERLNPEAPVPVLHVKNETAATGGAGNTAKNVAALGARATLVSVAGADQTARRIKDQAAAEAYEAVLIQDPARPSTEKRRYVVASQQMLRVDHEETHDIAAETENGVIAAIKEHSALAHAIIVSDYAKGVITQKVAESIIEAARTHRLPIMADVKPSHIDYFTGATYISPNRKEAHEYLGLNQHVQGGRSREELAAMLFDSFKTNVFLTLSEEGMFLLTSDTPGVHVPQEHIIQVADTSGCGDTAAVAITLAKLAGATDVEAAQLGNAAGAIVAQKPGAVAVKADELLAMITHRHESVPLSSVAAEKE